LFMLLCLLYKYLAKSPILYQPFMIRVKILMNPCYCIIPVIRKTF
jgi:hypothetical protein